MSRLDVCQSTGAYLVGETEEAAIFILAQLAMHSSTSTPQCLTQSVAVPIATVVTKAT